MCDNWDSLGSPILGVLILGSGPRIPGHPRFIVFGSLGGILLNLVSVLVSVYLKSLPGAVLRSRTHT